MKSAAIITLLLLTAACASNPQALKYNGKDKLPKAIFHISNGREGGTFFCKYHELSKSLINCEEMSTNETPTARK